MPIYLVTYDLNKESSSAAYTPLWDALRKLSAHRVLESVWLVNVPNTPQELHDHFKAKMDSNDGLFVTSVRKGENWYSGAKAGTNDWLAKNPPS